MFKGEADRDRPLQRLAPLICQANQHNVLGADDIVRVNCIAEI